MRILFLLALLALAGVGPAEAGPFRRGFAPRPVLLPRPFFHRRHRPHAPSPAPAHATPAPTRYAPAPATPPNAGCAGGSCRR